VLRSKSQLPACFALREEAREGWNHCVSDKLVHLHKIADAEVIPGGLISESHINPRVWIEANFIFQGQRDFYYKAIFELLCPDIGGVVKRDMEHPLSGDSVRREMPVFIDVAQIVDSPEVGGFVGIPVLIRLKRFDKHDGCIGHSVGGLSDSDLSINRISLANGEANLPRGHVSAQVRELPCEMIQRGTQVVNKIRSDESARENTFVLREVRPDEIPLTLQVFFSGNVIGVRFLENRNLRCESVEVFLRPLKLQIRVKEAHVGPLYLNSFG